MIVQYTLLTLYKVQYNHNQHVVQCAEPKLHVTLNNVQEQVQHKCKE